MRTIGLDETARIVARILARRRTAQEEIPGVIRTVQAALTTLVTSDPAAPGARPAAEEPATTGKRPRRSAGRQSQAGQSQTGPSQSGQSPSRQSRTRQAQPSQPTRIRVQPEPVRHEERHEEEPEAAVPAAPKLLRRAEVLSVAPAMSGDLPISRGTARGVVKWFDPRTGKGALRMPGYAGDLALDSKVMAEAGITRLYKGQEVEASIAGGPEGPRLVRLMLPGGVAPVLPSSGMVRGRRAKPVVVELKREALRRVAARAEAEQLLGPSRPR